LALQSVRWFYPIHSHRYLPQVNYTTEVIEFLDHDFRNIASGVIIPYGIYDIQRNEGFINLGNSRDRACQGGVFTSIELVKSLIEKTSTKTGLSVVVNLMDKVYTKGREVADSFKENLPIIFDEYLPKGRAI